MKKSTFIFVLFFVLLGGCVSKVPLQSWSPPSKINISGNADVMVIVNPKKGELLYDIMEDALRERFTSLPFLKVEGSQSSDDLAIQLRDYNFSPRIEAKSKIVYLSYDISEKSEVKRLQTVRLVNLRYCNYLLEKDQCSVIGKATLHGGTQFVGYLQNVSISLKDADGNEIVPVQKFKRAYTANMKVVPDEVVLRKKVSDLVAREYSKLVLPYREYLDVELLGGDSISVNMIEKGAYRLALKRLEKLITQEGGEGKTPENLYLQGITLEFQGDLVGALSFYNEAMLLDAENEVIKVAVERIERATSVVKKAA